MGLAKQALLRPASREHTAQLPGSFQEPQKEFLPPGEAAKPGHAGLCLLEDTSPALNIQNTVHSSGLPPPKALYLLRKYCGI